MNKNDSRNMHQRFRCYLRRLFAAGAVLSAVVGCAISPGDPLTESMIITYSQPGFWVKPGSSIYWHSDLVYLFNDARKKPENVQPFLQQEVQNYLLAKNINFTRDAGSAQYGLVAVVVLGEGMTATDVMRKFDLVPTFKASRKYEKGTIVVAFLDSVSQRILWRGALQGNIDLDLPPAERQLRVREAIARLLAKVPRREPEN